MSLEAEGSAQAAGGETASAADAGNSTASTTASAGTGSNAAVTNDWMSGLEGDNRTRVANKNWKTPNDIVSSYAGLEAKLGQSLVRPADDAPDEAWSSFYAKLGRPEKADEYSFKLPEGLPDNFPYQQDSAVKFKNWAHSAGLTPRQSQSLHDQFVKDQASQLQAHGEQQAKQAHDAHEALVKVWGDPTTETYRRSTELANRTLRQQGGEELIRELKGIGALGPNGEVRAPRLAQMLAKTGESLFAEDTLYAGPSAMANPFSAKNPSDTEAGKIIRADPSRARQLITAAGKDPKEYGL